MNEEEKYAAEMKEVFELGALYTKAMELVGKGAFAKAYEALNSLPKPETGAGIRFINDIGFHKMFVRACLYLYEESNPQAAASLLNQFIQEAPHDDDRFSESRETAKALLIICETEPSKLPDLKLTEAQRELFERTGMLQSFNQIQFIVPAYRKLGEAVLAWRGGKDNEFANKMAEANTLLNKGERESPSTRDLIRSQWIIFNLIVTLMRQLRALEEFDFERTQVAMTESKDLLRKLQEIHSGSEFSEIIHWGPEIGHVYHSLIVNLAKLAMLIKKALSEGKKGKQWISLKSLGHKFQEVRDHMIKIEGPDMMVAPARILLLEGSAKGLQVVRNLRIRIRPSRQDIVSVSGLAAAVSFLFITAITFFIGNFMDVNLNPTTVLALGAFFGLVIGFGYGAIRFRGFLSDLLGRGGGGTEKTENDGA